MANATLDLIIKLKDEASAALGGITDSLGGIATIAGGVVVGGFGLATSAILDFSGEAAQAQRDLQAQLGITEQDAAALAPIAEEVFVNGWGQDIGEATAMLGEAKKQLDDLGAADLSDVTQGSAAIVDNFGGDFPQVINTVNTLMDNFGLSGQQAMDFITKGYQQGLDSSGDFLDSIGEYAPQFAEMQSSAGEFFSALESGQQGGVLGTDKVADLFKETRLRIGEETTATREALTAIGIDADTFYAGLRDGSISGIEAFGIIQEGLRKTSDPIAQNTAAITLMGTQWEDLGADAVLAIDLGSTGLETMAGATDSLNVKYGSLGAMAQGAWRMFLVAMQPVGDQLLGLANNVMPQVQVAIGWIGETLPSIVQQGLDGITAFTAGVQSVATAMQPVADFISANIVPILSGLAAMLLAVVVPAFATWATAAYATAAANVAALAPVLIPIAAIGAAVALLVAAWQNDFGGIRTFLEGWWNGTIAPLLAQLQSWLAVVVPQAITALAEFWTGTLQPALQVVWSFVQDTLIPLLGAMLIATFQAVQDAISVLAGFWNDTLWPALQAVWVFMQDNVIPIFEAVANVAEAVLGLALRTLAGYWKDTLKPALDTVWSFIQSNVIPIMDTLANTALKDVQDKADSVASFWNTTLKPAFDTVADVVKRTLQPALNGIGSVFDTISDAISGAVDWLNRLADAINSLPSMPGLPGGGGGIPGFASGTSYAPGGLAWVGERGPELVDLPRGSRVYSNRESERMARGGAGGGTTIYVDARGSSDPRAVEEAGYRGAQRALREAGQDAEMMRRTR